MESGFGRGKFLILIVGVLLASGCRIGQGNDEDGVAGVDSPQASGRQTITVGVGDDQSRLFERNKSFQGGGWELDETIIYGGDLLVRYDDRLIWYTGCARRVAIDSRFLSEDLQPITSQDGSDVRASHVTAVFISGCNYHESIDGALEEAGLAVRQLISSPGNLAVYPRYSAAQLLRQSERSGGLDCAGLNASVATPEEELRCLVENERRVWHEFGGMERRVAFAVLDSGHARASVSLIAVNRRLSPIANSLKEDDSQGKFFFYVYISIISNEYPRGLMR